MRKTPTIFLVVLISLFVSTRLSAQVLLTDDFNYSGKLTSNGWTANSGGGTNADTTTTGLTYPGHLGSGIGNAVLINSHGGEDDNRAFSDSLWHNGDVVYLSFLVKIGDTTSSYTGDYFINLGQRISPTSVSGYSARFFARVVNNNVNFGLTNDGVPIYGTTNFAKDTTYLVIIKYTVNTGGNDTTCVWIVSSGIPATEAAAGAPEAIDNSSTGSDVINAVVLRQGSSGTYPRLVVDDIRAVKSWTSINHRLAAFNKRSSSFGLVPIGTSAKDTVVVKNDDDSSLVITKVTSGASVFTVTPSSKATLPPGVTHQYVITYSPTAAVTSSSWIVWTSNASSSPDSVPVSGTGFQAGITVSTHSYSFGNVFLDSTAVDSITVTNALPSSSVTIDSVTSSNHTFTVAPTSGTLGVGASMKIGVTFVPTVAGPASSSINFYGGGKILANPLNVSGKGIVKAPVFLASAKLKDFHGVLVGKSWKDSITVSNIGYDSLFISAVTSTDPSFTVTPTSARLDSQTSKIFYVTFTPSSTVGKSGSIVFTSNAAEGADTIRVAGSGASYVSIAEVRKETNGLNPDHASTQDTLFARGVVTSGNLQSKGGQTAIFIQDSTAGVEVFQYSLPPVPMVIGDSVFVIGTVYQYHGATEFEPIVMDTLHFGILKHNAEVPKAKHLTLHQYVANAESYEGLFVEIDTLYKVSGTWPGAGVGAAMYVTNASRTDTAELYISSSTNIGGWPEPSYPINVVAIINQYSSGATVLNDGYEIEPSDTSNITKTVIASLVSIAEARKDANHDLIADHSVAKDTLQIYGVVTTPNLQSKGNQTAYFIQDATAGIEVFASSLSAASYSVGDSVMVLGSVAQDRGLVEFVPFVLDTLHFAVLKHKATVPAPQHVTLHQFVTNAESYEGLLVEVDTLYYVSGTWPSANADGMINLTNASKADTMLMYTSASTNIAGSNARAYPINVIGVVSQYTSSASVYNDGYRLELFDTTDVIHTPGTAGVQKGLSDIPATYVLYNSYPNPFNPSTTIMYGLPEQSRVTVKVYSVLGQEVRTLVNDVEGAAYYHVTWDGRGESGNQVSSGIYFFRIIAEPMDGKAQTFTQVKKMVLLK